MPNRWTFKITPIKELLARYEVGIGWIDPFCGSSSIAETSQDLSTGFSAIETLRNFPYSSMRGVLFDPPYSPRQISECYKSIGLAVSKEDTQNQWTEEKNRASLIIQPGGLCISFGWNSNGLGKSRGFEIEEILLVSHGAAHNDTIVTVERKNSPNQTAKGNE
jgi:hypothetical protein